MAFLGCGATRLAQLARQKKIVSFKRGKDRMYPLAGLRAYLAQEIREAASGSARV